MVGVGPPPQYITSLYSESFMSRWREMISRTVPVFERMTSEWVRAPSR